MKEIVFLGGKEIGFECLEYLVQNADALGIRITAVLSNDKKVHSSNAPSVKEFSLKSGIPVIASLEEYLALGDFDILISVQYHEILKLQHIKKAKQIAVNLHMAPLPEYRGCNQFSFALIDQAREFGTTFHRMEEKIDGGDIMFERRFIIPEKSPVSWLYEKTFSESVLLFKEKIKNIISGNYSFIPQKKFEGMRPSSFHLRSDIEKIKNIDLSWDKEKILRHFRATYFPPFPPPYTLVDGKKIEITPDWIRKYCGAGQ